MHVVIYKFTPKTGLETQFIESWKKVTEGIYQYRGSLGSRLHKDENGNWIAYAQWPSKEVAQREIETPDDYKNWFKKMIETLDETEVLYELEIVGDLLKPQPADSIR